MCRLLIVSFLTIFSVTYATTISSNVEEIVSEMVFKDSNRMEDMQHLFTELSSVLMKDLSAREEQMPSKAELAEIRAEMEILRREVRNSKTTASRQDEISSQTSHLNHEIQNHKNIINWLKNTLSQTQQEINEVLANVNTSVRIQEQQQVKTTLAMIQSDVADLRSELTALKTSKLSDNVIMAQIQQELQDSKIWQQRIDMAYATINIQIQDVQFDLETHFKEHADDNNNIPNEKISKTEKHDRHMRHEGKLKFEINHLRKWISEIRKDQTKLYETVSQINSDYSNLRKSMESNKQYDRTKRSITEGSATNDLEIIRQRLFDFESKSRQSETDVKNLQSGLEEVNKLQLSIVQLFQSMESLESKYDKDLDSLKVQSAKLDFTLSQVSSNVEGFNDEQESRNQIIESVKKSVSRLDDRVRAEQIRNVDLQSRIMNMSLQNGQDSLKDSLQDIQIQNLQNEIQVLTGMTPRADIFVPAAKKMAELTDMASKNYSSFLQLLYQLGNMQDQYLEMMKSLPQDCDEWRRIYPSSVPSSGIYPIAPLGSVKPIQVFCDMNATEGWTIVQRRFHGKENFTLGWDHYKKGFGKPEGDMWIGNDALHQLTNDGCATFKASLRDVFGQEYEATYSEFIVGPESDNYRIKISGYSGNSGDALAYHNNMQFSTKDSDNDLSQSNCADEYGGGWWYKMCQHANLNGASTTSIDWFNSEKNTWIALAFSELKIKRSQHC